MPPAGQLHALVMLWRSKLLSKLATKKRKE